MAAVIAAEIFYAGYSLSITEWNKVFFDALQAKSVTSIAPFLRHFLILCGLAFTFFGISNYLEADEMQTKSFCAKLFLILFYSTQLTTFNIPTFEQISLINERPHTPNENTIADSIGNANNLL